jgi:Flp pilus assembly protein TadG
MLVPAAVLVLVILASITVDAAVAFLGQRELANAAAAAANDAVTAGLSDVAFYRGTGDLPSGTLLVDPARAADVARHAVTARVGRGVRVEEVTADVSPSGDQLCVTVRGEVPYVFARALPFVAHQARVRGQAGATAVRGEPGSGAVRRSPCSS